MAAIHSRDPVEYREITGILTGVGVGPGDPDLMTIRAAECVRSANCVAWMATGPGRSRARDTAANWIRKGVPTLEFVLPTIADPESAERLYDAAAARIEEQLQADLDVACLCEGDPMFYGSFMYLHTRIYKKYRSRIIPGIPSTAAAAAALGAPLAARSDRFATVPASLDDDTLLAAAEASETVAFLKVGRHLSRLRTLLESRGLAGQAAFVENASLPEEALCPLLEAPEHASYFSMVILRRGRAATL